MLDNIHMKHIGIPGCMLAEAEKPSFGKDCRRMLKITLYLVASQENQLP